MHSIEFSDPLLSCSGKNFEMPWKSQGKLREFSFSKIWPPFYSTWSNFHKMKFMYLIFLASGSFIKSLVDLHEMYQETIFSPVNTHFKKFIQKPGLGCTSLMTVQMKRFNALFRSILSEFRSITVGIRFTPYDTSSIVISIRGSSCTFFRTNF